MSIAVVVDALALPVNTLVNQRIPKKILVEQGAPTATDKRQIQDGIEDLQWVAALKPSNLGVPVFQNTERSYIEIAVLTATFRHQAKVSRLTELIHRAVPYPVLLVSSYQDGAKVEIAVSAAHKRFAQNDVNKFVVNEILNSNQISFDTVTPNSTQDFLASLAISNLPTRNLFLFYQGWINSIVALAAANITGRFTLPKSIEHVNQMQQSISNQSKILDELSALRKQSVKEKQIQRLVELNSQIRRLELQLTMNQSTLSGTNF